jgi:flagellar export protein FliJ
MAGSRSLRRLCEIRQAEEEQSHVILESAVAELQHLVTALAECRERVNRAQLLIALSMQTGELVNRIAGLEESRSADRMAQTLASKIDAAENEVREKRRKFLDKRIERRQVETVCEAMKARDAVEMNRRNQLLLDDWHRSQRNRIKGEASSVSYKSDIPLIR